MGSNVEALPQPNRYEVEVVTSCDHLQKLKFSNRVRHAAGHGEEDSGSKKQDLTLVLLVLRSLCLTKG